MSKLWFKLENLEIINLKLIISTLIQFSIIIMAYVTVFII
jgi:hypothetical protein